MDDDTAESLELEPEEREAKLEAAEKEEQALAGNDCTYFNFVFN